MGSHACHCFILFFIYCAASSSLPSCNNLTKQFGGSYKTARLLEKWANKSLVSVAHWTDPWQFGDSLCPLLLFADFDEFLLHQAAQIQTDALLIYHRTRSVWGWRFYHEVILRSRAPSVGVCGEIKHHELMEELLLRQSENTVKLWHTDRSAGIIKP